MARNNMTFTASMRLKTSEFKKGIADIRKGLNSLKSTFLNVAGALGAGLGLTKLISNLKDTAVQLSVAKNTLENVSKVTKEYSDGVNKGTIQISNYGETLAYVKRLSSDYSQDLVALMTNFAQFHAACEKTNLDLEAQKDVFEALTKAAAYYHMSADRTKDMMNAITQMMSKGKVAAEELRRQLGNSLPGAFNMMAAALGVTTQQLDDMMHKGQVISSEALPRFAAMLNTVTKNADFDSLQMSMNRLKNTWYELVESSGAEGLFNSIVNGANSVLSTISRNISVIGSTVKGFVAAVLSYKLFTKLSDEGKQYTANMEANYEKLKKEHTKYVNYINQQSRGNVMSPMRFDKNVAMNMGGMAKASSNLRGILDKDDVKTVIAYNKNLIETAELKYRISGVRILTQDEIRTINLYNAKLESAYKTSLSTGNYLKLQLKNLGNGIKNIFSTIGASLKSMGIMAIVSAVIGAVTTLVDRLKEMREEEKRISNIFSDYQKDVEAVDDNIKATNITLKKNLEIMQDESKTERVRLGALKEINKQLGLTGENAFNADALDKTKQAYKDIVAEVDRWIDATLLQAKIQIQATKAAEAQSKIDAAEAKKEEAQAKKTAMIQAGWYDQQGRHHEGIDPSSYGDAQEIRKLDREITMADKSIEQLRKVAEAADKALEDLGVSLYDIMDTGGDNGGGGGGNQSSISKVFDKWKQDTKELENKLKEHAITQEEYNEEFDKLVQKYYESIAATGSMSIDAILDKADKGKALTAMEKWYKEVYEAARKAGMETLAKAANEAIEKSLDEAIAEMEKMLDDEMKKFLEEMDEVMEKESEAMFEDMPKRGKRDKTFDYKKSGSDILSDEHKLSQERVEALQDLIDKYKDLGNKSQYISKLLAQWREELKLASKEADTLEKSMKLAKIREDIKEMEDGIKEAAYSGVKELASSMDRVVKGAQSLAETLDDSDATGWEKFIAIFNETVQIIDTVIGVMETLNTINKLSATLDSANAALIETQNAAYSAQLGLLQAINAEKEKGAAISATAAGLETAEAAAATTAASAKAGEAIAGATASGSKLAFPYNLIAIAAGVAAVIAALASMDKFATGGIVGGKSYSGDNQLARVNSGEMILNKHQQATLFNAINSGKFGGGNVEFKIRGSDLVGTLNNYGRLRK